MLWFIAGFVTCAVLMTIAGDEVRALTSKIISWFRSRMKS